MISYPIFEQFPEIYAFTTTKQEGYPLISRYTGDQLDLVQYSKNQLANSLGIKKENIVFPRQTHSANVKRLECIPEDEITDTDALITSKPGICICIQTADCVPLILYDPVHHALGVIHAGWRGTFSEITAKTVHDMSREFHSSPSEIYAVIGPSIGPENYETGDDVAESFRSKYPEWEDRIIIKKAFRSHLDLWETNRLQLVREGLQPSSISVHGRCTYEFGNHYYSARREGIETGRMATGIILKEKNMNTFF